MEAFSIHGLPVLFHCGVSSYYLREEEIEEHPEYGEIRYAYELVKAFPNVRFIAGHSGLFEVHDVIKMLGICEYLLDHEIVAIAGAVGRLMPAHGAIIFNSLSEAHGTDRFFRRVFGLHVTYRSPQQLCDLMGRAGIGEFRVHRVPVGVYHVIVGRKGGSGGA